MTSQLHKKPPTTQQNIPPQIPSRWFLTFAYLFMGIVLVSPSISAASAADENPFVNKNSVVNRKPFQQSSDPLNRLRKRSAQNRFDKIYSNWQSEPEIQTPSPKPVSSSSRTAYVVEVIDVESFKQTPSRKTRKKERMRFHHLFDQEEKNSPPNFPAQAIRQYREPVRYDGEPVEQEKLKTVRDMKKITEILPYHDYNTRRNRAHPEQGKVPQEVALSQENYSGRHFPDVFYHWEAPQMEYQPLYFEDIQLERYGQEYPHYIQPFVSMTKFGIQLIGLPYQMGIDSPRKAVTPLGYYRPGEATPKLHYQIPFSAKGAALQAGTVTGLIFLLP